jgi:hypothetical protein
MDAFKIAKEFIYLGRMVTNSILIEEDIKRTLNLSNACCQSFQNQPFVFLCALGNVKFRIYKTLILPVVLYGVKLGV